jgi:hypothetical protein
MYPFDRLIAGVPSNPLSPGGSGVPRISFQANQCGQFLTTGPLQRDALSDSEMAGQVRFVKQRPLYLPPEKISDRAMVGEPPGNSAFACHIGIWMSFPDCYAALHGSFVKSGRNISLPLFGTNREHRMKRICYQASR